jgi:1,4-dihydroxy-2-naphthoate octaprenyltransferase
MLAAHLWLAVGVWALIPPLSAIWGLLSLPLGLVASVLLWLRAGEPQRLRPVLALTIATASVHGLAMAAGLLSMRWTG